jgi:hypothetical protein
MKVLLLLAVFAVQAGAVSLYWDKNPETNIAGYKTYVGPSSRVYTSITDVGTNLTWRVPTNFLDGRTNYYAVTAYDTTGLESDYSDEVTYFATNVVPPPNTNTLPSTPIGIQVAFIDFNPPPDATNQPPATNNADGLVARWQLDDANGSIVVDSVNGQNGTLQGVTPPYFVPGKSGYYALEIPSSTAAMASIPATSFSRIRDELTISLWFKAEGEHANQWAFTKWGKSGHYALGFSYKTPNKIMFSVRKESCVDSGYVESTNSYNDGYWHYAVGVRIPGQNLKLYIDGNKEIAVGSGDDIGKICDTDGDTDSLAIGNYSAVAGGGGAFVGTVDDVMLYNKALTPSMILSNFSSVITK